MSIQIRYSKRMGVCPQRQIRGSNVRLQSKIMVQQTPRLMIQTPNQGESIIAVTNIVSHGNNSGRIELGRVPFFNRGKARHHGSLGSNSSNEQRRCPIPSFEENKELQLVKKLWSFPVDYPRALITVSLFCSVKTSPLSKCIRIRLVE